MNTWLGANSPRRRSGDAFGFDAYNGFWRNFGANYPLHIWSYPPHSAAVHLALGPDALHARPTVFTASLGLTLYLAVATDGQRRPDHLLMLILAPPVTVNIWCGQNGFMIAALLIGGLTQLDRRSV